MDIYKNVWVDAQKKKRKGNRSVIQQPRTIEGEKKETLVLIDKSAFCLLDAIEV